MSRPPRQPLFLARQTYRWRRATDAARLLPILGVLLFLFPLLRGGGGTAAYSAYMFMVWLALIIAAAFLSNRLSPPRNETEDEDGG
ncbi:hypothetical protein ACMU_09780 [Actibacterium mucosum KCTC 23349]|uniref:Uncharacterized protein n=1 Tax=Actibacterium mucosum KCTC 23349 TaxID=1454373 RepID=A0A037ZKG5_9RHOB|nr:hypothetical protein [Actibacterium mucosum]KAJ56042.1 hypothetical protein ACMU_09780 [Actibacterium mucosum KCTC 23349]